MLVEYNIAGIGLLIKTDDRDEKKIVIKKLVLLVDRSGASAILCLSC